MNNKEIKKIQFGGWSKRPFSEIRKKIGDMADLQDEDVSRPRRKKKKVCKFTKGEHKYVVIRQFESSIFEKLYTTSQCELCGKLKYEW